MATTFHCLPDLPAELRVFVWRVALEDDYDDLNGCNRIIELHHYNSRKKEVRVTVSRRYPTPFEVNREARCETAKAAGGDWLTMNAHFDGRKEPKRMTNFKIYINFSQDTLFLSTRFAFINAERKELELRHSYESVQLKLAFEVFSTETIAKITQLLLSTIRNSSTRFYSGEGLERFPALKRIHLISGQGAYLERFKQEITRHLHKTWTCQGLPAPRLTSYPYRMFVEPPEDIMWLVKSKVVQLAANGVHGVEWGFRKDLLGSESKQGVGYTTKARLRNVEVRQVLRCDRSQTERLCDEAGL